MKTINFFGRVYAQEKKLRKFEQLNKKNMHKRHKKDNSKHEARY